MSPGLRPMAERDSIRLIGKVKTARETRDSQPSLQYPEPTSHNFSLILMHTELVEDS